MKALLLIAHGSRRQASNDEVRQLTKRLRQEANGAFERVECGFLELAEPSIDDIVNRCIAEGANDIRLLPYFLAAGTHVVNDIPTIVAGLADDHPQCSISVLPYFGSATGIPGILLGLADR